MDRKNTINSRSSRPKADEAKKPLVETVIDAVVDTAAAVTKSVAKSAVKRVAKKAVKTKIGKAATSVGKKAMAKKPSAELHPVLLTPA